MQPLNNKYARWYAQLIAKRVASPAVGVVEKHHIVPKCLGGSNDKSNLVTLELREHFVAHLLLTMMFDGDAKRKMNFALLAMCHFRSGNRRDTSRAFERFKRLRRTTHSLATRAKMADAHKLRKPRTEEQLRALSVGVKASYTNELRAARSQHFKGLQKSVETRRRMSRSRARFLASDRGTELKKKLSALASARVGANATRAGLWILQAPSGEIFVVPDAAAFCKLRGLSYHGLRNKAVGSDKSPCKYGASKGWRVLEYSSPRALKLVKEAGDPVNTCPASTQLENQ